MAIKRSRATYEADLQAEQAPFVAYGKPLPLRHPDVRDDGSFVPVWKQEVTDDRGRKRLHGAFTGGFSAGYFNTVGSKEGWTPSNFTSSRGSRKNGDMNTQQKRPEDFMDDEDLAEAAEALRVRTTEGFAALGSTEEVPKGGAIIDIFKAEGETMGIKLMRKMGWREEQGVGPKVRRKARLGDLGSNAGDREDGEIHLFAPEDTNMIDFTKKNDHKGLGYEGEIHLATHKTADTAVDSEDDNQVFGTATTTLPKKKKDSKRSGIGIGVLNDTGSDDEDPYEVGPRISYNKVIGGEKKTKKFSVNGLARPVFISKKAAIAKASTSVQRCHDGRFPLDGFVVSSDSGSLESIIASDGKYLPPEIPQGWRSARQPNSNTQSTNYQSTADVAKTSKLEPKSRAALLGEALLPGKSVFDYLSSAARDRLISASGKTNLPPALGEIPKDYILTDKERQKEISSQIPKIDKDIAIATLGRGTSGWMPYADNETKRARYREYLEYQAGIRASLPQMASGMKKDDWFKELQEFASCAEIFKPMTGMMATRFTNSSSTQKVVVNDRKSSTPNSLLSIPAPKSDDPSEAAAKLGMFGPMTRSSHDFYPTRLLCKRFNVKPPAHVQLDPERVGGDGGDGGPSTTFQTSDGQPGRSLDLVSKAAINDMIKDSSNKVQYRNPSSNAGYAPGLDASIEAAVDPERNEALEGERAGEAVFKAIFGDDDDDDDD